MTLVRKVTNQHSIAVHYSIAVYHTNTAAAGFAAATTTTAAATVHLSQCSVFMLMFLQLENQSFLFV